MTIEILRVGPRDLSDTVILEVDHIHSIAPVGSIGTIQGQTTGCIVRTTERPKVASETTFIPPTDDHIGLWTHHVAPDEGHIMGALMDNMAIAGFVHRDGCWHPDTR